MTTVAQALGKMSYQELIALNKQVVAELRMRQTAAQMQAARKFTIGDLAQFTSTRGHGIVTIRIDKINVKSIHGICQRTGQGWKVSPNLLSHVVEAGKFEVIEG